MNGGIVVADKPLPALAVDVIGPPLFSGPSDYSGSHCFVDWIVRSESIDLGALVIAQIFGSSEPAFFSTAIAFNSEFQR